MHIYYVNLDHDVARRAQLEAQLAPLGLAAERVAALLPADIDPALIAKHCDRSLRRYVSPNELACTLSHQLAWRRMLDAGLPYALILEDDALLSSRLAPFLDAVEPLMTGIDVLHAETNLHDVRIGPAEGRIGDLATAHTLHSPNYGAAGYIITARAAEALLGGLCPLNIPVDLTLFWPNTPAMKQLRIRQAMPAPIANGPVRDALIGAMSDSNLAASRKVRMAEVMARYEASPHFRVWGTGWRRAVEQSYLRLRDVLRSAAGAVFLGVRKSDIPLL